MEYFPAHSKQQMIQRFEQETKRETGNEFVECLAFSEESGVVMTGNQTDEAEPDKVGTNQRSKLFRNKLSFFLLTVLRLFHVLNNVL